MLARTALRIRPAVVAVRSSTKALGAGPARSWSSLKDPQYSAHSTSQGSRADGVSRLDVSLSIYDENGDDDGEMHKAILLP